MKFDLPTTEAILQDLRDEIPYMHAAESNGVGYTTFLNWLELGKRDINLGLDTKYTQFLKAVRQIEKERIRRHTRNIGSDERSHKGSEWILERAFWKQFGKASEIDLNERVEKLENLKANEHVSETKANAGTNGTKCEESTCDEEN